MQTKVSSSKEGRIVSRCLIWNYWVSITAVQTHDDVHCVTVFTSDTLNEPISLRHYTGCWRHGAKPSATSTQTTDLWLSGHMNWQPVCFSVVAGLSSCDHTVLWKHYVYRMRIQAPNDVHCVASFLRFFMYDAAWMLSPRNPICGRIWLGLYNNQLRWLKPGMMPKRL